jgi:hypothetical protein
MEARMMKLALNLPQFMDYRSVLERTLLAERLGYHSVWLQDHMWQLRTPELDHPEAIATMAALAARTSRILLATKKDTGTEAGAPEDAEGGDSLKPEIILQSSVIP